jgi:dimethylhistidine N-methyltransferase
MNVSSNRTNSVLTQAPTSDEQEFQAIAIAQRLTIDHHLEAAPTQAAQDEAVEVHQGLGQTPKTLPPRYFYDDYGSQLFEQICHLPEYYLTRTETQILQQVAGAIAQETGACELVELGSGSSTKTRILLDAYGDRDLPLHYMPVDVSAGILETSARDLLRHYPTLTVHALASTYEQALENLPPTTLPSRMICFIGSTLGNLSPQACDRFLTQLYQSLQPGDYVLLGIDLQKDPQVLHAAYNDRQGVTAEFNLNMLRHLNRRFDGNFDLDQFEHVAFYNTEKHQIEMYLKSLVAQTVTLKALELTITFEAGELMLSEISRKFNLTELQTHLQQHGLVPRQVWTDDQQWFGLVLCQVMAN